MITQALLKELVTYDPDTGIFIRTKAIARQNKVGDIVGSKHNAGYLRAEFEGKSYLLHRLAYLYHYGYIPEEIDHIDGDKTNNKIENLRPCTRSQNMLNTVLRSTNTTGIKGISWKKNRNAYAAQIMVQGKLYSRTFSMTQYGSKEIALQLAVNWIKETRELVCKEFTNHSFVI